MGYEQDLIDRFMLKEAIARKKAIRLKKIKDNDDLLKFTIRFAASYDSQNLTNFRKYVQHDYDHEERYVITLDFRGCEGNLLQV